MNYSLDVARSWALGERETRALRPTASTAAPSLANVDAVLAVLVTALVGYGVVMVYSASAVLAYEQYHDSFFYLKKQVAAAVIGLAAMWVLARASYLKVRWMTYPVLVVSVMLLIATLVGFSRKVGGATRWIHLGPVNLQPAELAKFALILWLAYSLAKKTESMRSFSVGFLPHALVSVFLVLLCLGQPDFGSAMMLVLLTFILLFAAGARLGYILGAVLGMLPFVLMLVVGSSYRMQRIKAFVAPLKDRYGIGYQVSESLLSFKAGGLGGIGLGDSRQKLFYLPAAHTDFISSIIGEEQGFIGIVLLVLLFIVLVYRGLKISMNARDEYGALLALGMTLFVGVQAFVNLAVALGLMPTKGLTLPFVSSGGSSLIINCAAMGVVLSVSRSTPRIEDDGVASREERVTS